MADTVDSIVQLSGKRIYKIRLLNTSDGTGEALVVKVDKSTLTNPAGVEPTRLNVREIQWSINGFTSVRLFWDHATDDELANLATGNGYRDYTDGGVLADPASAGGTGDILLSTAGAVSGATYDIYLTLELTGNAS
jgi:hypothetical protein